MVVVSDKENGDKVQAGAPIWWSNTFFFCGMHLAALMGVYYFPIWARPWKTILLCFLSWQFAVFGITIGYHRLYSHRAFTATRSLRVIFALMGCLGFQGSIKWWCMRHRLHHRYTDDPVHDPYCATKGLYYSHMGWIFRKPTYPRMSLIDRSDLDSDPVVRFQHRYYVPMALGLGLVLPTILAHIWHDALGGLIWGGIVARLLIWHCTFIVNSFAHWEGSQPYSDEMSARGNLMMALLTGGEARHNFHHAFPRDYRAGPDFLDWDPSKWIIAFLYQYTNLVKTVRVTEEADISLAKEYMRNISSSASNSGGAMTVPAAADENETLGFVAESALETWSMQHIISYAVTPLSAKKRAVIILDGWVIDLTGYLPDHPGGFSVLRPYLIGAPRWIANSEFEGRKKNGNGTTDNKEFHLTAIQLHDAAWAFHGGMNIHSRTALRRLRSMRVAKIDEEVASAILLGPA